MAYIPRKVTDAYLKKYQITPASPTFALPPTRWQTPELEPADGTAEYAESGNQWLRQIRLMMLRRRPAQN